MILFFLSAVQFLFLTTVGLKNEKEEDVPALAPKEFRHIFFFLLSNSYGQAAWWRKQTSYDFLPSGVSFFLYFQTHQWLRQVKPFENKENERYTPEEGNLSTRSGSL